MATPVEWLGNYAVTVGAQATGAQFNAQTIGLANGNYLVAWAEAGDGAIGTPPGADIIGKIYDAEGNLVRDAYRLNTARSSEDEDDFDLVAMADGGFLIAYASDDIAGDDGNRIYWERYNPAGDSIDIALIADADGDDLYESPQITIDLLTGNSVVTYEYTEGGDVSENLVAYGRIVSADGAAGAAFIAGRAAEETGFLFVNSITNSDVAVLTGGRFVTAYFESDDLNFNPEARIFDNTGALITRIAIADSDFDTTNLQIAALSNGNWVAAWRERSDILFRVFNSAGAPVTGVLPAADSALNQIAPDVVALPDGDFVISWTASNTLLAQRYNANGSTEGDIFMVSPDKPSTTSGSSGLTADGRLIFASDVSFGSDGDVHASIWDPRGSGIFGFTYQDHGRTFLDTDVITARRQGGIIFGGSGITRIFGQSGNDSVFGAEEAETILGRGGDDSIRGGGSIDRIDGDDGADTIEGGQGGDVLNGGADRDTVSYAGSDAAVSVLINGNINTNTGGHADSDELIGFEALIGSGFNDTLRADIADRFGYAFHGLGGNDSITGSGTSFNSGGNDTLFGDKGLDTIFGSFGADWIDGGADADSIDGGAGNDRLFGGAGADSIFGGAGGFGVFARGGNDRLFGDAGADTLSGGVGDDTLGGGVGGDALDGGTEIDWADYSAAVGKVIVDLQTPAANRGEAAGDSHVSIENVVGSEFNDTLRGDAADNVMAGGLGGDDDLTGRGGSDTLIGGHGRDTVEGGGGADQFRLDDIAAGGSDTIVDFGVGADTIALLSEAFDLPDGALNPARFVVGNQANDASDRLIYNSANGRLFFDPDGTGAQAQVLIATLTGAPTLGAGDFVVI